MRVDTLTRHGPKAMLAPMPGVADAARKEVDVRGRTITTAIALEAREALSELSVEDELELLADPFPALVPDLEAWCRATGTSSSGLWRRTRRVASGSGRACRVGTSGGCRWSRPRALGDVLYACGPSLEHFGVDPKRLALEGVVVCEYMTFVEVMQQADVQLYA